MNFFVISKIHILIPTKRRPEGPPREQRRPQAVVATTPKGRRVVGIGTNSDISYVGKKVALAEHFEILERERERERERETFFISY